MNNKNVPLLLNWIECGKAIVVMKFMFRYLNFLKTIGKHRRERCHCDEEAIWKAITLSWAHIHMHSTRTEKTIRLQTNAKLFNASWSWSMSCIHKCQPPIVADGPRSYRGTQCLSLIFPCSACPFTLICCCCCFCFSSYFHWSFSISESTENWTVTAHNKAMGQWHTTQLKIKSNEFPIETRITNYVLWL